MLTLNDLQKMEQETEWSRDDLVDIKEIKIENMMPIEERFEQYLSQIKNPYHFICDGIIVNLKFCDTEADLKTKLSKYLKNLKRSDY